MESSIVLVQKKSRDGSIKYRFLIDYRSLNAVTKPDAYPIQNIVDTLDSLGRGKIFTVLDMASGYHQIPIKPEYMRGTSAKDTGYLCKVQHQPTVSNILYFKEIKYQQENKQIKSN